MGNITRLIDRKVPGREALEQRLSFLLSNWSSIPQESLELAEAARNELEQGHLAEAYCFLVLADSYVLTGGDLHENED